MYMYISLFLCVCVCIYIYICEQYWTSPGSNIPQGANYTVTYHLSRKLYKLDEPDMPDTGGEAKTRS